MQVYSTTTRSSKLSRSASSGSIYQTGSDIVTTIHIVLAPVPELNHGLQSFSERLSALCQISGSLSPGMLGNRAAEWKQPHKLLALPRRGSLSLHNSTQGSACGKPLRSTLVFFHRPFRDKRESSANHAL